MSDIVLSVKELHAGYTDENILHGVSIEVRRRSIVAIIGPNGSGKSTLIKTIYGLVRTRRGEVRLVGADGVERSLGGVPTHRITAFGANMVPQIANVFADLTVHENLEIGCCQTPHKFAERIERVLTWMPQLGTMLGKRAAMLSGGQRQMLAVGRALMSDPSLLILDEPSAGLAPAIQDEVFERIKSINQLGVSVLMVEQRARQCLGIADYAYVLEQGRNRLEGTGAQLLGDPEVIRLYLGAGRAHRT
ncbi:ABC transporter ATP-binding protein [Prosthecomicrobium hirschii]|uniref:ABC transporter ATP-binding protein n=1 Tax=Prosthecodimorpha hirschii TaxID=665126 RepID=UPI00112BD9F6|nr:ABC transporter ATP-binding protein [Prosthecomicrobium hirschii]TPQ47401.1 ABC transporter ATP-binding protein [Prosthecomicrobium hirschii]